MPFYAQLSQERIVLGVTQTSGPLEPDPLLIEIEGLHAELMGRKHNAQTGQFEEVPNTTPALRRLAPLAFRLRFTRDERAAIEWAAVDHARQPDAQRMQAASLRSTLKDQDQATYIDLDDPETIQGVQLLESAGLIHSGRAAEILSAPVQPKETP